MNTLNITEIKNEERGVTATGTMASTPCSFFLGGYHERVMLEFNGQRHDANFYRNCGAVAVADEMEGHIQAALVAAKERFKIQEEEARTASIRLTRANDYKKSFHAEYFINLIQNAGLVVTSKIKTLQEYIENPTDYVKIANPFKPDIEISVSTRDGWFLVSLSYNHTKKTKKKTTKAEKIPALATELINMEVQSRKDKESAQTQKIARLQTIRDTLGMPEAKFEEYSSTERVAFKTPTNGSVLVSYNGNHYNNFNITINSVPADKLQAIMKIING